jgi:hypothetical protein
MVSVSTCACAIENATISASSSITNRFISSSPLSWVFV